jgi:hypothetical protein
LEPKSLGLLELLYRAQLSGANVWYHMLMPQTIATNSHEPVTGYWINAPVSDATAAVIAKIQNQLMQAFPEAVWSIPRPGLHISLMCWVNPLHSYQPDNEQYFQSIQAEYLAIFEDIIKNQAPIPITFHTIEAFPAAVIIKGHDDGSCQRIRDEFMQRVQLPAGTKPFPTIIHSTIARFQKSIELDDVKQVVSRQSIAASETIKEFRLAKETINYMLEYDTVRAFKL